MLTETSRGNSGYLVSNCMYLGEPCKNWKWKVCWNKSECWFNGSFTDVVFRLWLQKLGDVLEGCVVRWAGVRVHVYLHWLFWASLEWQKPAFDNLCCKAGTYSAMPAAAHVGQQVRGCSSDIPSVCQETVCLFVRQVWVCFLLCLCARHIQTRRSTFLE